MPRGNKNNLELNSDRTPERRKEIARAGGIASGKARAKKKNMMETMRAALDIMQTVDGQEMTGREAICLKQLLKAVEGDTKSAEYCRDTAGEKAPDKLEANVNNDIVIDFGKIDDND